MIRPEEIRLQKILDAVEGLGITSAEKEIIEAYLQDEKGEECLKELTVRDLGQASEEARSACRELVQSFINKERDEELRKMIQILFALGHSSCCKALYNMYGMKDKGFREKVGLNAAQCTAIFAHNLGSGHWMKAGYLHNLYEIADFQTSNLLTAIDYCCNGAAEPRLFLYTTYFWKKYPDGMPKAKQVKSEVTVNAERVQNSQAQASTQKTGIFGTLSKLFGSNAKEPAKTQTTATSKEVGTATQGVSTPLGEDSVHMKRLEAIVIANTDKLLTCDLPIKKEWLAGICNAVASGKVDDKVKAQVRGFYLDDHLMKLVGGCALMNYELSPVLKAFLTLGFALNTTDALKVIVQMDGRGYFNTYGGDFDDIFGLDSEKLIRWTVWSSCHSTTDSLKKEIGFNMLVRQFHKNRQLFMDCQKQADYDQGNFMLEVIEKEDKALYKSMIGSGASAQKEQIIKMVTARIPMQSEAIAYLRGEKSVDDMYLLESSWSKTHIYGGMQEWKALEQYHKCYEDRDFYNRVHVLMSLCGMTYFFNEPLRNVPKNVPIMLKCLQEGGLDKGHLVNAVMQIADLKWHENDKKRVLDAAIPVFLEYLKESPEETKLAFANSAAYMRYFGLCVMERLPDVYKSEILSYTNDTAKQVKEKLAEILKAKFDWRTEVTALLNAKKAAERELAIGVLAHWNQPEDIEALQKLLEKEKNAKVRNLLCSVLKLEADAEDAEVAPKEFSMDDLVKSLHKGGKKRSLAWAYETPFSEVHKKDGEVASEEYLQAILLCYVSMTTPGISKDAGVLAAELNEAELAVYVNELFDKWLESGAEAKKRWVMYAASIHGGSGIVKKLHHQIQEWPQNARGAIAADAVKALALNPQPQALLLVDGIARKFKFKQVKAAAGEALEYAAEQLGLTREELEDKIVPNLGFDENMERHFDYGERSFTVTITPALEIEIFGEDGKKVKNLPAPGKKDDEEKANAAYEAFKEMKKQMKTTVSSQKMRLEMALSSERLWSVNAWQELFVKNPIMHQFAIGLIWGIYENHKLTQSFRYMEDGSFNTEEEDEYTLPEQGMIGLVHPIELSAESKEAWKQQLEDYEITQPIEQLDREIFYRTSEEENMKVLERFGGMYVNDLSLNGKLQQMGWYRGYVLDGGGFDTFYREDAGIGLGASLHFSGTFVSCQGEDVTVYDAGFYKAGDVAKEDYSYNNAKENKQIPLKDVPARYFSEIVLQLSKATASSTERDANWKKKRR